MRRYGQNHDKSHQGQTNNHFKHDQVRHRLYPLNRFCSSCPIWTKPPACLTSQKFQNSWIKRAPKIKTTWSTRKFANVAGPILAPLRKSS